MPYKSLIVTASLQPVGCSPFPRPQLLPALSLFPMINFRPQFFYHLFSIHAILIHLVIHFYRSWTTMEFINMDCRYIFLELFLKEPTSFICSSRGKLLIRLISKDPSSFKNIMINYFLLYTHFITQCYTAVPQTPIKHFYINIFLYKGLIQHVHSTMLIIL